jgi:hypothetical protein
LEGRRVEEEKEEASTAFQQTAAAKARDAIESFAQIGWMDKGKYRGDKYN